MGDAGKPGAGLQAEASIPRGRAAGRGWSTQKQAALDIASLAADLAILGGVTPESLCIELWSKRPGYLEAVVVVFWGGGLRPHPQEREVFQNNVERSSTNTKYLAEPGPEKKNKKKPPAILFLSSFLRQWSLSVF